MFQPKPEELTLNLPKSHRRGLAGCVPGSFSWSFMDWREATPRESHLHYRDGEAASGSDKQKATKPRGLPTREVKIPNGSIQNSGAPDMDPKD